LEIARREKTEDFSPRLRQALERWHEPAALEILKDTPIDMGASIKDVVFRFRDYGEPRQARRPAGRQG
jgi:hypothetical protein